MDPVVSDDWLSIYAGDCRSVMASMAERSVQCVITSPPFYGLRDYSTASWEGGDPDCDHTKVASGRGTNIPQTKNPDVNYPIAPHRGGNPNECVRCGAIRIEPTVWGGDADHEHVFGDSLPGSSRGGSGTPTDKNNRGEEYGRDKPRGAFCECGAWRGALGLEPTYQLYVDHLVEVFRGVRRVLRDDGVAWLNLGDSYVAGPTGDPTKGAGLTGGQANQTAGWARPSKIGSGLPNKNLIGVPWRVAFALQEDGWYLRQDIVWNKPNAMPESVEDRPSRSHEFIFMLTKQPTYFYDHIAVKEPASEATIKTVSARMNQPVEDKEYQHDTETRMGKRSPNRVWSDTEAMERLLSGRNLRDVWTINTIAYPDAHYAVFPPKLVEPMVKASTSEGGCCPVCDRPLRRKTVEKGRTTAKGGRPHDSEYGRKMHGMEDLDGSGIVGDGFAIVERETVGWEATCGHVSPLPPKPCVVFDPFGGSGTVGLVAQQLGRRAVLVDLNPSYIEQQLRRNAQVPLGL